MTPPRWRCACACFCFLASCSLSRRFCSVRLRFSVSFSALVSARRCGAGGLGSVGRFQRRFGSADGHAGLDRLDLGDVAGDRDLGVVLGVRLAVALPADAFALLLFAGPPLGLALCARLGHWG